MSSRLVYKESVYQEILSKHLGGSHYIIKNIGTTDITSDTFHAEIKSWKQWKSAVGQLLTYNFAMKREHLRAYFFDSKPTKKSLLAILECLKFYNIDPLHIEIVDMQYMIIENLTNGEKEKIYIVISENSTPNYEKIREEIIAYLKTSDKLNLDTLATWTNARKAVIVQTLKNSYEYNVDYTIKKTRSPNCKDSKYGGNIYYCVYITKECFIKFVMKSSSKNSDLIRDVLSDFISENKKDSE